MNDAPTIIWDGKSGNNYKYWIHVIEVEFKASPGNYVFAKKTLDGRFRPIYVGETGDLSERFDNHHKMGCIKNAGATHICVHTSGNDDTVRRAEEADIIEKWQPSCNG